MKAYTILVAFIIAISVIHAQETASAEASSPDTPSNTTSNSNPVQSIKPVQQLAQQSSQSDRKQTSPDQADIVVIQNNASNPAENENSQQQSQSISPQLQDSSPQNKTNPDQNQPSAQTTSSQPINQVGSQQEQIGSASPGLAFQGLSQQQQQQLLVQQQLLQQHQKDGDYGTIWKYANYTKQQLHQLQKKWQQQTRIENQNALKQMQQRERKEREQLQKMIAQQKLTKTQQMTHKQNLQFRERQSKFNPNMQSQSKLGFYDHHFNEYMFQLNAAELQDFQINLTVPQNIAFHISTYTNNDGVYYRATEIDDDVPPEVHVYEDGKFVIVNEQFHFKKFVIFEGKANSKYLIRMINPGKPRLFSLNIVQIVDQSHVSHALTGDDFITYGSRAARIHDEIKSQMETRQALGMMEVSNQKSLNTGINHYFRFSILELVLVIGACVVQLKLIQKLLTTSSVV